MRAVRVIFICCFLIGAQHVALKTERNVTADNAMRNHFGGNHFGGLLRGLENGTLKDLICVSASGLENGTDGRIVTKTGKRRKRWIVIFVTFCFAVSLGTV